MSSLDNIFHEWIKPFVFLSYCKLMSIFLSEKTTKANIRTLRRSFNWNLQIIFNTNLSENLKIKIVKTFVVFLGLVASLFFFFFLLVIEWSTSDIKKYLYHLYYGNNLFLFFGKIMGMVYMCKYLNFTSFGHNIISSSS